MKRDIEKSGNWGTRRFSDPFRDFFDMGNLWPAWSERSSSLPAVNVSEDEKCYCVDVAAPGFKKEDFKINVDNDVLSISAEKKTESTENDKNRQYSRREYSYSSFTRSFRLPENAKDDSIEARYEDGVLKLEIPKTQEEVKASKEIKIS
ncbi:Hsp20/alpha crystallin family protein [Danxiaibacter flavus]|uniref:Hsp20/alpha crystallin family protein n=1 Tax=Danxiaibacter flavus TaxID=3049108 RepID=A0ABV3ZLA6_9BACT|nr:Hsp20/alpha crystallin family protein [Chitinophagaceae bacterium DXS]